MVKSTVEQHPSRAQIEADLRSGVPITTTSRGYGLSRSAVSRFRKRVLKPTKEQAQDQENDPTFILGQFKSLYSIAAKAASKARDSGNSATQIAAQKEARATLTLIGKLIDKQQAAKAAPGAPATGTSPPPEAVQAALIRALEPHPQARAAVVDALTKLESEWRPAEKSDE